MKNECTLCPRRCILNEGQTGACGARENISGVITCGNYGKITSLDLDPIEKKPLQRFYPGALILSVGSYGCNLHCPFCQNHRISMSEEKPETIYVPPEKLVEKALSLKNRGNIGIAYTYNEPLVGYEYVTDCARLAHSRGLKNIVVTNGCIEEKPFRALLPFTDAFNIDLKGFDAGFYQRLGGDMETVKRNISIAAENTHVEVTTLIIPGENDNPDEFENLASWLSGINSEIPLHISRFFPQYKYAGILPTPVPTIYALADIARKHLSHAYTGNC